jgi:CRP-like cAMP-binding protein
MPHIDALVRKLRATGNLSEDDVAAIRRLPIQQKTLPAKSLILAEGDQPNHCTLVIQGFCLRSKTTDDGKRQILSMHMNGDIPDLRSLHLPVMDHDFWTLSESALGIIPHEPLRALTHERPSVADALWREALVDAAICREWIVNIGRRDASARLAHLVLELREKMVAAGLCNDNSFGLPITQQDLADALGITPVHVNRVLQSLRASGALDIKKSQVKLRDPEKLAAISAFSDTYLRSLIEPQAAQHVRETGVVPASR